VGAIGRAAGIRTLALAGGVCGRCDSGSGDFGDLSGVGFRRPLSAAAVLHVSDGPDLARLSRLRLAVAGASVGEFFRPAVWAVRVLLAYFALFVLFCSANQYSWLQTSTGFRYLVPVVPALALLAVQAGQALPRPVRWLLGGAALAQSVIIAAAHQSDIWLAASALIRNRFELPWMIRLHAAGLPVNWLWPAVTFLALALAVGLIWRNPQLRAACVRDHEYKDA
jgi:hypothetical protein